MTPASDPGSDEGRHPLRSFRQIVTGVLEADPAEIEHAARQLGGTRRLLAPLAFVAGTLALMVVGVKPLVRNWRLTLVEFVPAAWIWVSLWNLKSHVLDQRGVHHVHSIWYVPAVALFVGVAVLAFWCNAVFIFAITSSPPLLRPAIPKAREHLGTILAWGIGIGSVHAFVSLWVSQQSKFAYDLSLSIVVAVMMVTFVTVPASLAGFGKRDEAPRDHVARVAVGSTLAAIASMPGFLLDRIGLLLIASRFKILGFALLSIGVALEVAATSSTKAVKISARLVTANADDGPIPVEPPQAVTGG
jgi:hypothetical protein